MNARLGIFEILKTALNAALNEADLPAFSAANLHSLPHFVSNAVEFEKPLGLKTL